ncbi:hypothetical protein Dvina_43585 [Dactylosporangium vinaceum]|uniref:Uncharacterized protein n=1 Tax=Dactylosporangium vinaceum TaxID=53362 RepID=A0ABV5MH18_9ACTN|nr:hypothetical protein [Dactylosporangium vinaceum]UAB94898.1 hypothetical protein Dvina_43585 [Dactylosporangium vinaceum]
MFTTTVHFGPGHPLADVARRHCDAHRPPLARIVACGACWELAIRDDERFAVECGLPRELTPDPNYVDEIAVDLACRGERVELTRAEFTAAVVRLHGRGMTPSAISKRLHASFLAVLAAFPAELIGAAA